MIGGLVVKGAKLQRFNNLESETPETPRLKKEKAIKIRALNQCARELLLLQSSDWMTKKLCIIRAKNNRRISGKRS